MHTLRMPWKDASTKWFAVVSSSDFLELTPSRVKRSDAAKVILLSLSDKRFGKRKKGLRTPAA